MEQEKIQRINALSRKARTPEGLTQAEIAERAELRQEYVRAVVGNLDDQLAHTILVDPQGRRRHLHKKEDGQV